jgi:hypothetical protein
MWGGKSGVVRAQLGQGVDMICGRRVDRRIHHHHHRPACPVVAATAMVEAAAGVIISSTFEGEATAVDPSRVCDPGVDHFR